MLLKMYQVDAFASKGLVVELEALELDARFIRFETDEYLPEVGMTGHRTDGRELLVEVLDQKRRWIRRREDVKQ